ncbi:hypothetical protein FBU30_004243 [Linnemannia zychae]|nr:hypothetical protein FBU30_004243 [Linnemannia zychae]
MTFHLSINNNNNPSTINTGHRQDQSVPLPSQQPLNNNSNDSHTNHNDNKNINHNNDYVDNDPATIPRPGLEPPVTHLDANTQYLSYLPFGGLTNQFMAVQSAAYIALKLNRTLILPPIISNSHDHKNTHQRWSQYMDLPRFTQLTGLPVIEWDQARPLTDAQRQVGLEQTLSTLLTDIRGNNNRETPEWAQLAENFTTQIVYGYGGPDVNINLSARNFWFHFLIRPIFVYPPPPPPGAPVYDRTKYVKDNNRPNDLVLLEDLLERYKNYDDRSPEDRALGKKPNMLFLSNSFKIKAVARHGLFWREIGKSLHFAPKVMEFVTQIINQEVHLDSNIEVLPNNDPEEAENTPEERQNPNSENGTTIIQAPKTRIPHIAVHLRRGDIGSKCVGHTAIENCLIPLDRYVDAVERAREYAASKLGLVSHLPVVVTTDSTSEDDYAKIKQLGWHRMDHTKYRTTEIWGSFGPAMVDAAILAHADVLIGSSASTMSQIAGQRQLNWYGHESFFPKLDTPVKASETGEGSRTRKMRMMARRLEEDY